MKISRSNLAEQLRDYQIRSRQNWAALSFFSSTAHISSRADAAKAGLWALVFLFLLSLAITALYLKYKQLASFCLFLAVLLPTFLKIVRQTRLARRRQRRMLLPLSI